ncbi:MAG: hypothetical protein AAF530_16830 [Pseudomonadota bacterium]
MRVLGSIAAMATCVISIVLPGLASADESLSLSGSYEGNYACDSTTAGVPSGWGRTFSFTLVQKGDTFTMDLRYYDGKELGKEYSLYAGKVTQSTDGALLSGYFESCGGTFPSKELARFFPFAPRSEPLQFSANSIWVSDKVPNLPGLTVQTCRWFAQRVSSETPTVRPCESHPIQ